MSDLEADYDASVVMVDPNEIVMPSDEEPEIEDQLTIDMDDDDDSYDPMSLVSVGLGEEEDEEHEDSVEDTDRQTSNASSVACQYCGRVLSDEDAYRRHLNNMHQIQLPSSPLPPASLSINTSPAKKTPKQRPIQPKPVFNSQANVRKCPDCDQQFATKTTLNIHRLKVHVAGLKNLPCPQCNQEVPDLTSHMRKEHNVDGIVCPHCANIFSKKCTLNRHIEQVSSWDYS